MNVTRWVSVSTPRISACTPMRACSPTISFRLSMRSAISPPYGPSSSVGSVWRATTMPRSVAEPVSTSTSHACAVVCIQVPISEIACPAK